MSRRKYPKDVVIIFMVLVITAIRISAQEEDNTLTMQQQAIEKVEKVHTVDEGVLSQAEKTVLQLVPPATPKRPRRILIYATSHGPHRFNIPTATEVLKILGRKTGAYEAVVSTDLSNFEPDQLKQFDSVCFANATGDVFLRPVERHLFDELSPEEKKKQTINQARLVKNLTGYVKDGGGFIGIHAATDCLKKNPEYGEMVGGYFDGHPWSGSQSVTVRVDEPDHALCHEVFSTTHFTIKDEIYQFKDPYDRSGLRVLLSIDLNKSEQPKKELKRADLDYPVSWIKKHGRGRVFYSSLGHNNSVFSNPLVLDFLLGGIQYANGDIKVDDTPK